jgi:hypothetical protein
MFMAGLQLLKADCSRRTATLRIPAGAHPRCGAAGRALYWDAGLFPQRFVPAIKLKGYWTHTMKALFSTLGAFLVGGLILLGIGGIAFHLFRDDGWLSQGLGALWRAQYQAPVMTIILIIAAIFVFKALYKAQIGGKRDSKIPDFVLFAFIATGIFFLGRLITTGQI